MADPNSRASQARQRQPDRHPTDKPNGKDRKETGGSVPQVELWNMGEDHTLPPPREWLLGRTFCRRFVSGLAASGGTGKTAVRIVQTMSVATGRDLTGERVYGRFRTLYVALEDNLDEIRRRVWAAAKHYDIPHDELLDYFYMATPMGMKVGEASHESPRDVVPGLLEHWLRAVIREKRIDLVVLDPFVKIHTVDENDNGSVDQVVVLLARIATECNCAVDVLHHQPKGRSGPGDPDRLRGASALRDGIRLLYTLTPMQDNESKAFNLPEAKRRSLMRLDSAKTNLNAPAQHANWYNIVDVPLDNKTEQYPEGDRIQTCEVWVPPGVNASGITPNAIDQIFDRLERGPSNGRYYSRDGRSRGERQAWPMMKAYWTDLTKFQAEALLASWLRDGFLVETPYHDPVTRKDVKRGLKVQRRPPS